MREFNEKENAARYLGRVFGVLAKYTHSDDYMNRMQSAPLSVLALLHLKAIQNGMNENDEMFIADCLDRINVDNDSISFNTEEYGICSLNHSVWHKENVTVKKLLQLLQARKITQQQIAEGIGLSVSTVQRWATEKMVPEKETFRKLIHYYNDTI